MLGIFIYGCLVSGVVATAIGLIAWGIRAERHDRELLARELAQQPGLRSVASRVAGDAADPAA